MARTRTARRKAEVYTLTISGLAKDSSYYPVFEILLQHTPKHSDRILADGSKSHLLLSIKTWGDSLGFKFGTFVPGHRPDVIDASSLEVTPSPLNEDQTDLVYTFALMTMHSHGAKLVIQKGRSGMWPSAIERYFQWFLYEVGHKHEIAEFKEAVLTIDPMPDPSFKLRLSELDRVRAASISLSKPNPGWPDYEEPLYEGAEESGAQRVELSMNAPRNKSLDKGKGILSWINDLVDSTKPFRAKVFGSKGGEEQPVLDTSQMVKHSYINIALDVNGQYEENSVLRELGKLTHVDEG